MKIFLSMFLAILQFFLFHGFVFSQDEDPFSYVDHLPEPWTEVIVFAEDKDKVFPFYGAPFKEEIDQAEASFPEFPVKGYIGVRFRYPEEEEELREFLSSENKDSWLQNIRPMLGLRDEGFRYQNRYPYIMLAGNPYFCNQKGCKIYSLIVSKLQKKENSIPKTEVGEEILVKGSKVPPGATRLHVTEDGEYGIGILWKHFGNGAVIHEYNPRVSALLVDIAPRFYVETVLGCEQVKDKHDMVAGYQPPWDELKVFEIFLNEPCFPWATSGGLEGREQENLFVTELPSYQIPMPTE